MLALSLLPRVAAQTEPSGEASTASFDSLAKSAAAAREAGKIEDAVRDYQGAVEIRTDWEEGWWYLGTLQYDSDHFGDAIAALKKVAQLDPALGPAWNFLGLCEFATHDYSNSLQHLQKGQDLGASEDPEVARVARYHLALLLNRSGDFAKATAMLTSAFPDQAPVEAQVALGLSLLRIPLLPQEVDPSQDALVQAAGVTASIATRKDTARTLDSLRALLNKYPKAPYLHYAYGIALASVGRDEAALLQQKEEASISPQSALPYLEISSLELRLHHPAAATYAAEMAVRLAPDSSAAHRALGQSLLAQGEKEKGARELRAAETLIPEEPVRDARIVQMYAHHTDAVSPETAHAAPNPTDSSSSSSSSSTSGFDEFSRQAAASQAAGNGDDAIRNYQQALRLRPEWDEGQWNLAMLFYTTGNYPETIAALKACLARQPNNGTAWAVMGLSEFEIKDYNNALIHLQRGQDLGLGGNAESVQLARYRLATLLDRNADFDRATDLLAAEIGRAPRAREIQFVLGMALLRIPLLPEQVETSKDGLVRSAGEIAALLQDSKYDEAFPKFQTLLRQYPATPFLHYAYGTALAVFSQYDEAETQLHQELLTSPNSGVTYARLASIALKTRHPADALPSAQRAVQLEPESAEAHYLLGRSFLELGQQEKAMQELVTASRMAPGSPEVHFNLAKAYARANLPEKAEQERATFARLNALAELQRSQHGSQSYSGSHDKTDFSIPRANSNAAASPETH